MMKVTAPLTVALFLSGLASSMGAAADDIEPMPPGPRVVIPLTKDVFDNRDPAGRWLLELCVLALHVA